MMTPHTLCVTHRPNRFAMHFGAVAAPAGFACGLARAVSFVLDAALRLLVPGRQSYSFEIRD